MGKLYSSIIEAGKEFSADACMVNGAALAYYTIFSLPPLFMLVIFVAGLFGIQSEQIHHVVSRQMGLPTEEISAEGPLTQGSHAEQPAGGRDSRSSIVGSLGPVGRVIGIGILLFTATGVFVQLQYSLNKTWGVEPDPQQGGVWNFISKRLLSLGIILVIAFLLLVSMVMTTVIEQVLRLIQGASPGTLATAFGYVLNEFAAFVVATLLFAAMFRTLPDARMKWRDLWVGSAITAGLWVIGKSLIAVYLRNSDMAAGWGNTAASLIAALVWVYYSSLIVLFGAELTQVWTNRFGSGIEPLDGATLVVETKRHIRTNAA